MASTITFSMIKPDAIKAGHCGAIINIIEKADFTIKAAKLTKLDTEKAGQFYQLHKERPFYNDLITYISSGPVMAMILEKENAVKDFRTLIGATNPAEAKEGTIRKLFATSIEANAIHGSDSNETAQIESHFFFSQTERF